MKRVIDWFFAAPPGFQLLEEALLREDVTEIAIDGLSTIQIEERGQAEVADFAFENDRDLKRSLDRLVKLYGSDFEKDGAVQAARLALPNGKYGFIRRYRDKSGENESAVIVLGRTTPVSFEDYLRWGVLSGPMVEFLKAVMPFDGRVLVSGNKGSGRVTLLSLLGRCGNEHARILHAGDMPKDLEREKYQFLPFPLLAGDAGRANLASHMASSRADILIFDECSGPETWTLVRAAADGLNLLTSISAPSSEEALARLEGMALAASQDLGSASVQMTLSRAFHFLIQIDRLPDGTRKITRISELSPIQAEGEMHLKDIFVFERTGVDSFGRIEGKFSATGHVPQVVKLLEQRGIRLDRSLFSNERVSFPN